MIKQLHFKWMLLLSALMVGTNVAWAAETVHYTLDGTQTGVGGNSNYSEAGDDVVENGMNWAVTGNVTQNPWRIGGKNLTEVDREVYSKTAMGAAISKIELEIGGITLTSVNSIKLIVASKSDFSTVIETIEKTTISANSTLTFTPTAPATEWATEAYYKFVFNVTAGSSNSYVQLKSAKFYKNVIAKDPTITFSDGDVRIGKTIDLSTLFSSDSEGAVTYTITSGDSYASISGNILTGEAAGSVTVKATQAAAGAYSAGEKSATITVKDVTLSSIAVTTPPTKTTYTEGEFFDETGMVVTATFSDASNEDVTASCTFTPSVALTTSDSEITISYTENAVEKTTTQAITVNSWVQPTTVNITNWNTLFGTSNSGSLSGDNLKTYSGTIDNVTVQYAKGSGSNMYMKDTEVRLYNGTTLSFEAPDGYAISKIVFTGTISNDKKPNANVGSYDNSTKTWTGLASTVIFTGTNTSASIATAVITLTNTQTVGITAVGLATFVTDAPLDYTSVAGIEAYIATTNGSTISLTKKNKVPANTGVLLRATADGTSFVVPVATGAMDDVTGNLFVRGAGTAVASSEAGYYNYILNKVGDVLGFYRAAGNTVAKNRAYLHTTLNANAVALDFDNMDDMTTAIDTIEHSTLNIEHSEVYNLNGQRVSQPTKGLYIVNGKKVVVK